MILDAELVGSVAGTLTTVAYIPQAVKVYRTRSAGDLSWPTFVCLVVGIVLWVAYGWMLDQWPIVIANVVTLGLALAIVAGKVIYSPRRLAVAERRPAR
ncbi:SemiSWEET family sugar transporter [Desertibaculum subflavum]|uniref:SemiSWEET family sugar transporter n=1 Tax=Desertibaculum subflavum TaxID=2268458 RepID=UPI000E675F2E